MVPFDFEVPSTTDQPIDQTELLVLGDTHVGYQHRSQSKKSKWARSTDDLKEFRQAMSMARERQVDAVVHAGDVFDHQNTNDERDAVMVEIDRVVGAGIPFYFVYGNHDDKHGRDTLVSTLGKHLPEETATVGSQSTNLLGFDYSGGDFPTQPPDFSSRLNQNYNILVIHESPHPVVDNAGDLLYQSDPNKADISQFIENASFEIDLVVTGHLHVADQPRVQTYDIPVLVTGPTIPISKYEKDSKPSTWLLTVTNTGIEIDRQPV